MLQFLYFSCFPKFDHVTSWTNETSLTVNYLKQFSLILQFSQVTIGSKFERSEYFNKLRKTEQFVQLNCFRYFDYLKKRTKWTSVTILAI